MAADERAEHKARRQHANAKPDDETKQDPRQDIAGYLRQGGQVG
jgi:hypothetical protein